MLAQDVEIAHGPQLIAEPADLLAERLHPLRDEHGAGLAQQGAQAPAGDAHLVESLWILPESRPRIMGDDLAELGLDHRPHLLDGRGLGRRRFGRRRRLDVERAQELGTAVAVGGAGGPKGLLEALEIGLVAAGQLHLDLPEALDRARPAHHLHGVEHDLGDGPARVADQHALASRPQRGDGHQRGTARPDGDEIDHPWQVGRRPWRALGGAAPTGTIRVSGQLELESRFALGQLELPQALAALDAAAEGDTRHRQPMVRRVQVDVGERARGQRLARQMGEAKPRPGAELQLALERGLHLPGRTRVAHGHGKVLPRREGGEQLPVAG